MLKLPLAAAIVVILFSGCSRPEHVLYVYNYGWPAGTSISIIQDGEVTERTSLFGRHARLTIPRNEPFRIRTASPAVLTSVSREIDSIDEMTTFSLPRPVFRRTIGQYRLGVVVHPSCADTIASNLVASAASSFTTLSINFRNRIGEPAGNSKKITMKAHQKGIEVIAGVNVHSWNTRDNLMEYTFSVINSAEVCGVDGIVISSEFIGNTPGDLIRRHIRSIARSIHRRGMTLALETAGGRYEILTGMYRDVPAPECPDELRLDIGHPPANGEISSPVSTERIEMSIEACYEHKVPLSRLSVEMDLGARVYYENGERTGKPGELTDALYRAGTQANVRLRDGSLRLGYGGAVYTHEDGKGLAMKIGRLRDGRFKRMSGIHIICDGSGISPDSEMMNYLAESLKKSK